MKKTKEKIFEFIQNNNGVRPKDLEKSFSLSRVMIFRYLKELQNDKKIKKVGKTPHVQYILSGFQESQVLNSVKVFKENFLKDFKKEKMNFWKIQKNKNKVDFEFLLKSSALFSSKIEGNTLDLNSFLNPGVLNKAQKKEAKEIEDLILAYKFAQKHKISEKNFLEIHRILSKNILAKSRQGKYRKEKVGVFSSTGLEYLAIEPEKISEEIKIFFQEVKKLLKQKMTKKEVYFWSQWVHLAFVLIHPFSDGNGRVARLLEKWFLAEKLAKEFWILEIEKFYWENLKKYYESLKLGVNYWEVDYKKANKFIKLKINYEK